MEKVRMLIILLLCVRANAWRQEMDPSSQRLFGHSIKNGHLIANQEVTLFEHKCATEPCAITHLHCPTAGPTGWQVSLFKAYIDGETEPSVVATLADLSHVGRWNLDGNEKDKVPWGVALFGHTAANGGVYSTVRIPFGSSIKLTLTGHSSGTFWFIMRGLEDYRTVLGDLVLPSSARLKVIQATDVELAPQQLTTLAESAAGKSGALLSVRLDSTSKDFNYLEACMRIYVGQAKEPLFLSSGAEDYFSSAYYFNEGVFKTPESGLTYFDGHGTLSAYKIHDRDPILWHDGMRLVWRNCETTAGCGNTSFCPNQWCPTGQGPVTYPGEAVSAPSVAAANYSTTVWLYEWSPVPAAAQACPGGAIERCMDLCPGEVPRAFQACGATCAARC